MFSNILFHHDDFGSKAIWMFTATSHGKSVVDGIGGSLKSLARTESINMGPYNTILNAKGFQEFVKTYKTTKGENLKPVALLVTPEEIKDNALKMKTRWDRAIQIKGTQTYHHFEADTDKSFIIVKNFSSSENLQRMRVISDKNIVKKKLTPKKVSKKVISNKNKKK